MFLKKVTPLFTILSISLCIYSESTDFESMHNEVKQLPQMLPERKSFITYFPEADDFPTEETPTEEGKKNNAARKLYRKKIVAQKMPTKKEVPKPVRDEYKETLLKKTIRDMSVDELMAAKEYAALWGYKDLVKKYCEQLMVATHNQEILCIVRLELADIYFEEGDYKYAGKLYREYVKFYPGSKKRDYAEYKAILTRFYARLKPPLDQTKTRKTLILANIYLDSSDKRHKEYVKEVRDIRQACLHDLYEYEVGIFFHYFNLERITAAQTRLESIKNELMPLLPEKEPYVLELEGMVAQKQGNDALVNEMVAKLQTKFPAYSPKMLAAQIKPKKSALLF